MNIQMISTRVALLPEAIQQEVADYVEFLVQNTTHPLKSSLFGSIGKAD